MHIGTLVLCDAGVLRMAGALEASGFDVLGVTHSGPQWVANVSVTMLRSVVTEPAVLIASGEHCLDLPAVGFARRSARRPVGGYVFVDPRGVPVSSAVGDTDWPDAPVIVLTHGGGEASERETVMQARLRGWTVVPYGDGGDSGEVGTSDSVTALISALRA